MCGLVLRPDQWIQEPDAKEISTSIAVNQPKIPELNFIRSLAEHHGIDQIIPIKTELITVSEWVNLKCKYGCQRYGRSWCCPPETPSPDKVRAILKEYKIALILSGSVENPYFYKNSQKKRRIQVALWKGTVTVERELFLHGYYKAFSLVSENCALCQTCLYPNHCAFPQERRPSVEAFSIDIFQTLRTIGRSFKIYKERLEPYRYYSIILLE